MGDEAFNDLVAARRAKILGIYLGISFLAGVAATLLFPPPRLPAPMAQVLGAALVGSGLGLNVWAVRTMVRGGASPDASRPSAALMTWGPFRFSRNPMYLGFVLIYAGGGLLLNSIWIVLLAAVVVAELRKRSSYETSACWRSDSVTNTEPTVPESVDGCERRSGDTPR